MVVNALIFNSLDGAQTNTESSLFFTNLYPKGGLSYEAQYYHISTSGVGFCGQNGLDIMWWGGVKLRSAVRS